MINDPKEPKIILRTDWRHNPDSLEVDGEIYAIGDVHGQNLALQAVLDEIADEPRDPRGREIIFTGDLIDRGPDNIGAVRTAFSAHEFCDRLTVLPGNHEMMMVDGCRQGLESMAFTLWYRNGGQQTLRDIILEMPELQRSDIPANLAIERATAELISIMEEAACGAGQSNWLAGGENHRLIEAVDGRRILFVHAGIDPHMSLTKCLTQDKLQRTADHWAWIREPFLNHDSGFRHLGLELVVHGHTVAVSQRLEDYLTPDAKGQTVRPADLAEAVEERIDLWQTRGRICLDICAMAYGQVAALQIKGDSHRFIMSC